MKYLVDTNVFLHTISNIYGVAVLCNEMENPICVTPTIVEELDPGYFKEKDDKSTKEIYICINNMIDKFKLIKLVNVTDYYGAKEELKKIRERYYGWLKNPQYLQDLVDKGILKKEDIKKPSFRKKDLGECELLAIAKVSNGEFLLITNDRGRVFKHPDINIFDTYKGETDIIILTGDEWKKEINFNE